MKRIPEETRIQQINARPNIEFVRWAGEFRGVHSKAVCRCAIDGHEWPAIVNNIVNNDRGCPRCGAESTANKQRTPKENIESQINNLSDIAFVRWAGEYRNTKSKAIIRCAIDGHEWVASALHLLYSGTGCPKCCGKLHKTEDEIICQINARKNISFIRWESGYRNVLSKAICRCDIDGYEWPVSINNLINHERGCPKCAGRISRPQSELAQEINALPNISFVRWDGEYKNINSKVVCRCAIDGHEWTATPANLLRPNRSGCPQCAEYGYNPAKPGALYFLRSECGSVVKIGISNNYEQRRGQLRRSTPFDWNCIELLHSEDGSLIAEWEKELHSWTKPAEFSEPFDGYTEWRKWDDRLPMWIKRYRKRLERIVAP